MSPSFRAALVYQPRVFCPTDGTYHVLTRRFASLVRDDVLVPAESDFDNNFLVSVWLLGPRNQAGLGEGTDASGE